MNVNTGKREYRINVDEYCKMYSRAMKNILFVKQYPTFKRKAFIVACFALTFFSKKRSLNTNKVYLHYSNKVAETEGLDDYSIVFFGNRTSIRDYFSLPFYYNYMTCSEKISLFKYSFTTHKQCKNDIPWAYWFEFLTLDFFLYKTGIKEIMTNDHYSKLGSSLSLLCEYRDISYVIKQHGFMFRNVELPEKLRCNKIYAFDQNEIDCFKRNLVKNADCQYIERYVDYIDFVNAECDQKIIAIIENKSADMRDIISCAVRVVEKHKQDYKLYILLHPMSSENDYSEYAEKNICFSRERIGNADIMVSPSSTLFYNYLRSGYQGKILMVDTNHSLYDFKGKYSNLLYFDSISDYAGALERLISE